jgi:lipopolysaccharide/colanic/teichoic acid biosynthesis glycosyltransferase
MPTAKRAFDLILTIPTLIVLSPFFIILIILITVLLGAPVFSGNFLRAAAETPSRSINSER